MSNETNGTDFVFLATTVNEGAAHYQLVRREDPVVSDATTYVEDIVKVYKEDVNPEVEPNITAEVIEYAPRELMEQQLPIIKKSLNELSSEAERHSIALGAYLDILETHPEKPSDGSGESVAADEGADPSSETEVDESAKAASGN